MEEESLQDHLIYKTAPSRLVSAHFYFFAFLAAGLSAALTLGFLELTLPVLGPIDLNLYLPLFLAVLGLVLFLYAELRRLLRRYMIYERRAARREGILSKRIQYMPYNKVERVELNQSIIKRIFGIGDVVIDTGEDSMVFASVRRPSKVEHLIAERLASRDLSTTPL